MVKETSLHPCCGGQRIPEHGERGQELLVAIFKAAR
jgi:hypothetical protein